MSDIFVDNIKHQSSQGSGTITLGASGEKVVLPVTNSQLRFIASTDTQTNLTTQDVFYKTTWNEQLIDNFNEFSPTDYRFTASEAGTYLFYCSCSFRLNSDQDIGFVAFYKNGSASSNTDVYKHIMGSNAAEGYFTIAYKVALAVNDYMEIYSKWTSQGSNRGFNSGAGGGEAIWTGYRIA